MPHDFQNTVTHKQKVFRPHITARKMARTHLYRVLYGERGNKGNNTPWMDSSRTGGKAFESQTVFERLLEDCQFSNPVHINRLKLRQLQLGG